jgi:hypothetical protein
MPVGVLDPTNPTIQKTLNGLKVLGEQALPNVDFYTEIPSIPFVNKVPAMIVTEYRVIIQRIFGASGRGNPKGIPNLYSFIYLHAAVGNNPAKSGKTVQNLVQEMRNNVELWIESFKWDPTLQGTVMIAGTTIEAHYDRYGPYIKYFDQPFIGMQGLVDVEELYRF